MIHLVSSEVLRTSNGSTNVVTLFDRSGFFWLIVSSNAASRLAPAMAYAVPSKSEAFGLWVIDISISRFEILWTKRARRLARVSSPATVRRLSEQEGINNRLEVRHEPFDEALNLCGVSLCVFTESRSNALFPGAVLMISCLEPEHINREASEMRGPSAIGRVMSRKLQSRSRLQMVPAVFSHGGDI